MVVLLAAAGSLASTAASPPAHAATCGVLSSGAAPQAQAAVNKACGLLGTPYSWGGGHGATPGPSYGICDPANGAPNDCNVRGLDCSGMVRYAYYLAVGSDVINGTSRQQYQSSRAVARFNAGQGTAPLLPGDLVFFGYSASTIHHVAIYLGQGQIVEAPYSGGYVRVTSLYSHGDYYGAIRLYGGGSTTPGKYWVDTFTSAGVYASPTSTTRTGTLWAGTNYVYCRVWGRVVSNGSAYNHWWLLTDPDEGPARQYVSAYYLTRWGNDVAKDNNGVDIPNC
ncbi:Cell wall-associated hydrolase, NlpC family [Micromonospora pallida]|uniref:Cell wall-associated hydrolase, NlpC family n=1 Tax=Micromonospora pallida TaxID=145854 RepID=A0A1C6RJ56_9ACTN|nr:C40 family peptidase [Micromonospora pallida]SCL17201.1 Cell wall-associated hydrolase, NlpC family [Micromonospora pallida]